MAAATLYVLAEGVSYHSDPKCRYLVNRGPDVRRIRQKAFRRNMAINHRDWGKRTPCGYCAS